VIAAVASRMPRGRRGAGAWRRGCAGWNRLLALP
jgi:hypothetical protein